MASNRYGRAHTGWGGKKESVRSFGDVVAYRIVAFVKGLKKEPGYAILERNSATVR